jgi:MOSC domain-containing protein YiiM
MAELSAIFVCPGRGVPMEPRDRAVLLAGHGLEGCAHARPGGKRQVLLVSAAHLRAVGVEPGTIRENLVVEGADVQSWPVGRRVRIGGVELEVTMICDPCQNMEAIRPGLQAELEGRRGMLARVIEGGELAVGDPVEPAA